MGALAIRLVVEHAVSANLAVIIGRHVRRVPLGQDDDLLAAAGGAAVAWNRIHAGPPSEQNSSVSLSNPPRQVRLMAGKIQSLARLRPIMIDARDASFSKAGTSVGLNPYRNMADRCDTYWRRFVAAQVNAQNARSATDRMVWLQVAEIWLTMARAEQLCGASQLPSQAAYQRLN